MEFGIPEADAVRAASYNPACAIAADKEVGSIAEGKVADFLVCSADYTTKRVFLGGVELK
jgi:N-acetylglucosamine-6-phosphate deacetylase